MTSHATRRRTCRRSLCAAALVTAAAVVLLPPVVETSFLAASLRQEAGTHGVQQQLLTLPGVSAAGGPAPPYQALTTAATTAAAEAASSDSEHEWAHGVVGSSGSGGGGGGGAASGGRGRGPGADGIKRRSLGAARHGRRHVLWKENGWDGDLGVQTVMIYVKIPLYKKKVPQNRTVTAVATLWLRRMGGGQAGQYGMPHQHHDSIRGALWLEDPNDLSLSGPASHAAMPVCQDQWRPQLLLDTFAGGPPLRAAVDALPWPCTDIRPYSFSFTLPEGAGSCFKIRDASMPIYHKPFCLYHHARLCSSLAPPEHYTPESPALWAVFGPVRNVRAAPGQGWLQSANATSIYLAWYLSYHLAAGMSGVLLYGSALDHSLLQQEPLLQPYLTSGALRLLLWDVPERTDQYAYDHALNRNHVLLGLAACGTNLRVLVVDFDEYLMLPRGKPWPEPLACMSDPAAALTTDVIVNRRAAQSSTVAPDQEPSLWLNPSGLGRSLAAHPAGAYDMVSVGYHKAAHAKRLVTPAALTVGYFVHEGVTLHGATFNSPPECICLLHISNMVESRFKSFRDANTAYFNHTNWILQQ